jgi:hypothetical protein
LVLLLFRTGRLHFLAVWHTVSTDFAPRPGKDSDEQHKEHSGDAYEYGRLAATQVSIPPTGTKARPTNLRYVCGRGVAFQPVGSCRMTRCRSAACGCLQTIWVQPTRSLVGLVPSQARHFACSAGPGAGAAAAAGGETRPGPVSAARTPSSSASGGRGSAALVQLLIQAAAGGGAVDTLL